MRRQDSVDIITEGLQWLTTTPKFCSTEPSGEKWFIRQEVRTPVFTPFKKGIYFGRDVTLDPYGHITACSDLKIVDHADGSSSNDIIPTHPSTLLAVAELNIPALLEYRDSRVLSRIGVNVARIMRIFGVSSPH